MEFGLPMLSIILLSLKKKMKKIEDISVNIAEHRKSEGVIWLKSYSKACQTRNITKKLLHDQLGEFSKCPQLPMIGWWQHGHLGF